MDKEEPESDPEYGRDDNDECLLGPQAKKYFGFKTLVLSLNETLGIGQFNRFDDPDSIVV